MDMDNIELRLLIGEPVPLEGVGEIHSPLVKDIVRLGQSTYNEYLSYILVDKDKISVQEDERDTLTTFNVILSLCIHDPHFHRIYFNALKFFFKEEVFLGHNDKEYFFYLGDYSDCRYITKDNIEIMQAIIRIANQVKIKDEKEEQYNPANEEAARIIAEMLERRKKKPKPKPTTNLHSIISGLACKSNNISYFNVGDLTIYQLYDNFHRLEVIENYHYTLVGIYSGNVNGKEINFNKIHWTKIIEQ
ncbi:hypothetical protein [Paenibacillus xylaniclasticus]|uniref:hypothetical protein n=1 Tax=Paenibacillus xylaniclasticus TaxID=588083 RepID=UPI000FD8CF22|nr:MULTISPECIES: hypothetical protein [Paenibacillus]GFN32599.1 hypothetical protein PCURB6_28590 [Paenibacillus curdlanolyticus]